MGTETGLGAYQQEGIVWPSKGAHTALHPLPVGAVQLNADKFWGERQQVNGRSTIPLGKDRLERAGNLHDLRLAAGLATGDYRGPVYQDSDVYKWLEAIAWELGRRDDPELEQLQRDITSLVQRAQLPDGYLNSYYQTHPDAHRYSDLAHSHELYCAGHLMQAAIAQERATGEHGLLSVATRFADHLVDTFGPSKRQGVPGHPEVEMSLVELYRLTGHEQYLLLAQYFIEARGHGLLQDLRFGPAYYQDRLPVRDMTSLEGHAVRALYLAAGATDVAMESGDTALLQALVAQWEDMVSCKTYLTGGLGSRWAGEAFGEAYELPPDRSYCETCAAIASVFWSWRLLLATGERRYADLIERTLFNAVLPGVSPDGTRFLYVNPLQLRSGDDSMSSRSPGRGRQLWFDTACCPTNLMRFFASLDQYAWTATAVGLQCQQYFSARVSCELPKGSVVVDVETDYPWDGHVLLEVIAAPSNPWELALRVPHWCNSARVSWPGQRPELVPDDSAYIKAFRSWHPGDTITLELDMRAKRIRASRDIDSVYGCEAFERGPLVYCIEQVDLDQEELSQVRSVAGPVDAVPHPRLDGLIALSVPIVMAESPVGRPEWPYGEGLPHETYGPKAQALATPYFAWGRTIPGPMRVWVPQADREPQ
jgi:DUF1680 family protein